MSGTNDVSAFIEQDDDVAFEEELARNRYSVKKWLEYIKTKMADGQRLVRASAGSRIAPLEVSH